MRPPLRERLGWQGLAETGSRRNADRALLARAGFYLFTAGATIGLVSLLLPGGADRDEHAIFATALVALALGCVVLLAFDRLPVWGFQLLTALGTALVSSALYFGGDGSGFYRLLYVWVVLYAAYFFAWRGVTVQIAVVAVAYAVVLSFAGSPLGPLAWFLTITTLAVVAALVLLLKGRLEQLLADAREHVESLRELDRLKDAFVATTSHELRTPLTSIRGYLDVVLDGEAGELTDDQEHFLRAVDRSAERLQRLVGDLLFVSELEAGTLALQRDEVDVASLARESVESARPLAADKGIEVTLAAGAVPVVTGDRARLRQLLDNLVSNAIKFTPFGGHVGVTTFAAEGAVHLEVSDDGIGIAPDELSRVFERFFRSRRAAEQAIQGSGLGLAISKGIVEAHDGTLTVASAEGEGATFSVTLPVRPTGRTAGLTAALASAA